MQVTTAGPFDGWSDEELESCLAWVREMALQIPADQMPAEELMN